MVLPVDLRHRVVDGFIPSDLGTGSPAEIEEERRLLYVAMTSAKDDLHLIVPQRFFTHGQNAQGTDMFTPRGRASFRTGCWSCSTREPGRWSRPNRPRSLTWTKRRSMSQRRSRGSRS